MKQVALLILIHIIIAHFQGRVKENCLSFCVSLLFSLSTAYFTPPSSFSGFVLSFRKSWGLALTLSESLIFLEMTAFPDTIPNLSLYLYSL